MKNRLACAFAAVSVVVGAVSLTGQQPAPGGAPAQAARPAPLKSPDIHADRTVTFRLLAPKASAVTLNGSWDNGTNLAMTKDESGVWSTTIGPLAPQLWGYWFMVDGVKALDPNNGETQRDGSRYDNLLMVSGTRVRMVGFQGRAAWHRPGRVVSIAHAQDGEPPDDGVHAARLRDRNAEVCGALPAARRGR